MAHAGMHMCGPAWRTRAQQYTQLLACARLVGAHGLAFSTGLVRGAGQTGLALLLVALAGPEQRPLEGDVGFYFRCPLSSHACHVY